VAQERSLAAEARIEATVEWISPAQAREWLSHCLYERQRKLREAHVARLTAAIHNGRYAAQGITLANVEGRWVLTNGQHRLSAIVRAEREVREVVIRKWQSMEAVADEYGRTDIGVRRSLLDSMQAHDVGAEYALNPFEIKRHGAAAGLIQACFERPRGLGTWDRLGLSDPDERLLFAVEWLPEGSWYWKLLRQSLRGRTHYLQMAPVAAVAYVSRRFAPEQAEAFWSQVVAGKD